MEEELWEEEFIERCVLELLEEEEQWEWFVPSRDLPAQALAELQDQISLLVLDTDPHADARADPVVSLRQLLPCSTFAPLTNVSSQTSSGLNPNAKEFVPGIQKHVM